jgi:hypothetical protein
MEQVASAAWKAALSPLFTLEVTILQTLFHHPHRLVSMAWIWYVEVKSYLYVLASVYVTVPDRRSRILEVVIVRCLVIWVLGIRRGEGVGKGLRKGRSVYKQPETKVDGSCHS